MPTMAGAFAYDLWANRSLISMDQAIIVAIGFAAASVTALFVVRALLDFVGRYGFAPFAWWRIVIGAVATILLLAGF